jgi:hypothetical protein
MTSVLPAALSIRSEICSPSRHQIRLGLRGALAEHRCQIGKDRRQIQVGLCARIAEALRAAAVIGPGPQFSPEPIMVAMQSLPTRQKLNIETRDTCSGLFGMPTSKEYKMRKLITATVVFVLAGLPAAYARGGMHGSGMHGLMAPANPTVPPSLTPDPRLTGTAPLPPHHQPTSASSVPDAMLKPTPEEMAVDRAIGNICRGC